MKPGLYCVATPIGNLKDITLRALEVLKACDIIACEDTRESGKLLCHYGIAASKWSYHDHNADQMRGKIIEAIQQGNSVCLISDAGTPLISDPGTKLVRACKEAGLYVTTLPGASAVISGLVLSGLTSHSFTFLGFFDEKKAKEWTEPSSTLVFFESAKRLIKTISLMKDIFKNRQVSVVREISKLFEESITGTFYEVGAHYIRHPPKGEIVIVVGPPLIEIQTEEDIREELTQALKKMSFKEAVEAVSYLSSTSKKIVYKIALDLK